MQNSTRGGSIRIVGVAPCPPCAPTATGVTREVAGADQVDFYVDPVSGLRVLIPSAASAQVLASAGSQLKAHIRGNDKPRSCDDPTRGSARGSSLPRCRMEPRPTSEGCEKPHDPRDRVIPIHRVNSDINISRRHDSPLRDPTQPNKVRRKKKIFRNSLTVADDPSSLGESGDGLSEHSTIKKNKKSKKSKRHCDIHNPRRGSAGSLPLDSTRRDSHGSVDCLLAVSEAPGLSHGVSTDSLRDSLVCTCKPKRSKRPEPEGRSTPLPKIMNEYDRIILSDEPLFSDYGEDDDDEEFKMEQIKSEVERYHKRASQVHSDMFAAAQMVNTNTMLKFAIIGAELQNIIQVSLKRVKEDVEKMHDDCMSTS